jgi:hypothetical protein
MDEQHGKGGGLFSFFGPVAEAPLKVIIMLAKCKKLLPLVCKLFKSLARDDYNQMEWTS